MRGLLRRNLFHFEEVPVTVIEPSGIKVCGYEYLHIVKAINKRIGGDNRPIPRIMRIMAIMRSLTTMINQEMPVVVTDLAISSGLPVIRPEYRMKCAKSGQ